MTHVQPQEQVKVWQPEGFGGVEVEKLGVYGMSLPPTLASTYELTVAVKSLGNTTIRVNGSNHHFRNIREVKLGGQTLISNPNIVWEGENDASTFSEAWTLRFSEEQMLDLAGDLLEKRTLPHFPSYVVDPEVNTPLARLIHSTVNAFDDPHVMRLEREARLFGLLHTTLKYASTTPPADKPVGKEHRAIALVKEVLHADLLGDHSLKNLALLTRLNPKYLLGVFKRGAGLSPHAYLTNLRVQRAKQLLAQGSPAAFVAAETGFVDQSHLTHTFKKYVRVTPAHYQQHCWTPRGVQGNAHGA